MFTDVSLPQIFSVLDIILALVISYFTLALASGLFAFKCAEENGTELKRTGSRENLLLARFAEVSGAARALLEEYKAHKGVGDDVYTRRAISSLRRCDLYGFIAACSVLIPLGVAFQVYGTLIMLLISKVAHSVAYEYLVPLVASHRKYLKVRL